MMKSIGINEFFLPKIIPQEVGFRSASVDYSEDKNLTIPQSDLDVLNLQNWYVNPSSEAWDIANKYFDVCFFICHSTEFLAEVSKRFKGTAIWRVFGLDRSLSYTKVLKLFDFGNESIRNLGGRFWFGMAYDHLASGEIDLLARSQIYLPLGMSDASIKDTWVGARKSIFFVCPDIGFNNYYKQIYNDFIRDFKGFEYKIGGAQPVQVDDPNVQGFVSAEEHESNMNDSRVMFYHSQEPNHIHYHPFEAIRSGMPLIFLAGGMLDRMGGLKLPGRCKNIKEAREKIHRVLNDDWALIKRIKETQTVLLDGMRSDRLRQFWQSGFNKIREDLQISRELVSPQVIKKKRIAVIIPVEYRGGSLRGAKLLAGAIHIGSKNAGEPVEVVFVHLGGEDKYTSEDFEDLAEGVQRRTFSWKILDYAAARRAMLYAGNEGWEPEFDTYSVLNDGVNQLLDCDIWIIISDRLETPLLPIRPTFFMVYDYLQRYEPILPHGADRDFLRAVRKSQGVMVTTNFTGRDALQYAGMPVNKVHKVPMLAPFFTESSLKVSKNKGLYFLWTTNANAHKNHQNAFRALKIYYEELDGALRCAISGVNTTKILKSPVAHLKASSAIIKNSPLLMSRIDWVGELSEADYKSQVFNAAFVWHAGKIDNGTFSVVEAASLGVPGLSSDYPPMREIDAQFSLNLLWMNSSAPRDMAEKLKEMELSYLARSQNLPTAEVLEKQSVEHLAADYWQVVRKCL
ncbi:glycosytransferase [Pseudomonas sp. JV414]|uniref:glycosytransferase n=1 Tax=Pseudomonas sp. JV414 TaxID=1733110 RepID=UPI0028F42365|nr:glycosytransferase [Pseudomonas sp. JV414]